LTLFLKVLEKQQEAPVSTGFFAQKVGSRIGGSGKRMNSSRGKAAAAAMGLAPVGRNMRLIASYCFLYVFYKAKLLK